MRIALAYPVTQKLARLAAVAALVVAGVTIPGQAAQADDNGDGSIHCNTGEICFGNNKYGHYNMRKHFWHGANHGANSKHGDYRWFYVPGGYLTSERVMDSAQLFQNQDTACAVWVWDVDGFGNWFTYLAKNRGTGVVYALNPINNGHSRCGGTASYNPKDL